jgi:hypothetical protein
MLRKRIGRLLLILAVGLVAAYVVIYLAAWASVNEGNPWSKLILGAAIILFIFFQLYGIVKPITSVLTSLKDDLVEIRQQGQKK